MSEDTGWKCKNCGNFNIRTVVCTNCGVEKIFFPNQIHLNDAIASNQPRMEGICHNCSNARSGQEYSFYYCKETFEDDKDAIDGYLGEKYRVLGNSKSFICDNCIEARAKRLGIIALAITAPITLFGIFGYLTAFGHIFVTVIGLLGILYSVQLLRRRVDKELIGAGLAIKLNRKELFAKFGANAFFNSLAYNSLVSKNSSHKPILSNSATPNASTSDLIITCPRCGYKNPSKAIRCQQCLWLIESTWKAPSHSAQNVGDSTRIVMPDMPSTVKCQRCGHENPSSAKTCEKCMYWLEGTRLPAHDTPQSFIAQIEKTVAPSPQIDLIIAAANLATLNGMITLIVSILQFFAGGEAIVAGAINAGAAIYYFIISSNIRRRDLGALQAGLSVAKWGFFWVLGMFALYTNTSGGVDGVAGIIFGGWLITDGLLYLILQHVISAFRSQGGNHE